MLVANIRYHRDRAPSGYLSGNCSYTNDIYTYAYVYFYGHGGNMLKEYAN